MTEKSSVIFYVKFELLPNAYWGLRFGIHKFQIPFIFNF